jgi:hypothetical protein
MRSLRTGISGRIYYGFGTLLALGVMLTILALWTLSSTDRQVDAMGLVSDYSTRMQQISRDFVTMQRTAQRNSFDSADDAAPMTRHGTRWHCQKSRPTRRYPQSGAVSIVGFGLR